MLHPVAVEVIAMIEEIEAKNLGPQELVVAMRKVSEKIAAHPDVERQLPAGLVEGIRAACNNSEQANTTAKEADRRSEYAYQNQAISQAKFDRLADLLLENQPDIKKGN